MKKKHLYANILFYILELDLFLFFYQYAIEILFEQFLQHNNIIIIYRATKDKTLLKRNSSCIL